MTVYLGTDHGGFELKEQVKEWLTYEGHEVVDHGAHEFDKNDDYVDFIFPAAKAVAADKESVGIIFGGSGQGEAMAANRVKGARAAVYYGPAKPIKAVDIEGSGSITILAVTTMPGDDVTHPVPDNTGYITEGQFYLHNGVIDPFGSLSRLKQLIMGKVTREDHSDLANALIRLYADAKRARDRESMGFRLSEWDKKLIRYADIFEEKMMSLEVNLDITEQLDLGWEILTSCFGSTETGLKNTWIDKYGKWNNK